MSDQPTTTTAGLKPGEDPYAIQNDDPRVADTIDLLQSYGAPQDTEFQERPGAGKVNYLTFFIRDRSAWVGGQAQTDVQGKVFQCNSGLMVQSPKTTYVELKNQHMIDAGTATAQPPADWLV